jgi:hypothetical protein
VRRWRHGVALARRIPGAELLALDGGAHFTVFIAAFAPIVVRSCSRTM